MKRAISSPPRQACAQQHRAYWFDRFVRNPTSGGGQSFEKFCGAGITRRPGLGRRVKEMDVFFGNIPNYYEMEDRAMFDRKTLEPDRIRAPCGEIPDVETFLERADVTKFDLTEYSDQFEGWDDMMTCSYMEMVYKKGIPARPAQKIFAARELYNNGHIFHKRSQHDIRAWAKKRGSTPPFPENYYPHMRYVRILENFFNIVFPKLLHNLADGVFQSFRKYFDTTRFFFQKKHQQQQNCKVPRGPSGGADDRNKACIVGTHATRS